MSKPPDEGTRALSRLAAALFSLALAVAAIAIMSASCSSLGPDVNTERSLDLEKSN